MGDVVRGQETVTMGQRGDIQDAQRAFLKERNACGANVACLRRAYDGRINQLQAVMTAGDGEGAVLRKNGRQTSCYVIHCCTK